MLMMGFCMTALLGAQNLDPKDLETIAAAKYNKAYEVLDETQKTKVQKLLKTKLDVLSLAKQSGISESKSYQKELVNAQKSILMRMYLEQKRDSIVVSEEEIKSYYDEHLRDYTSVDVRTLVRKSPEDLEGYVKLLNDVSKEKRESEFIRLAKLYSSHPTKSRGGKMGFVGYGTIVQPFGKEAFKLEENTITQKPVKTILGYHLIYLKERKVVSYKKVKQKIENTLRMQKYKAWFDTIGPR